TNRLDDRMPLMPQVRTVLATIQPGAVVEVQASSLHGHMGAVTPGERGVQEGGPGERVPELPTRPGPNTAVEPTAPMVAGWQGAVVRGAAAHRGRSGKRRDKPAQWCRVQVPDSAGLANHTGPESCAGIGNGVGEALTGEHAGRVWRPEIAGSPGCRR